MSQNDSFICFMNLSFSQNLNKKRWPIDQEDPREPTNGIPYITWNSLNRNNDYNVLLLTLQVFSSERKYKMHDRWVDTADDDMVDKFLKEMLLRDLHLCLRFW